MRLSPHFHLSEFVESPTAKNLNIQNNPTGKIVDNLTLLCSEVLEKIRIRFNRPIHILSGYRCPELNTAVGGAKNSQHISGHAADIRVGEVNNWDVWHYIVDMLEFDQVIAEKLRQDNGAAGWIHVSYAPINRKQALSFDGKNLLNGLHFIGE